MINKAQWKEIKKLGWKGPHSANMPNELGDFLLHFLVNGLWSSNSENLILEMIQETKSIDVQNKIGSTPLMLCADTSSDIALALIKKTKNINTLDEDDCTALHYAIGNPQSFQALLENGCDPFIITKRGYTVFDVLEESKEHMSEIQDNLDYLNRWVVENEKAKLNTLLSKTTFSKKKSKI